MRHPTRRHEHVRAVTDPVCGMRVDPRIAISRQAPDGHTRFFCAPVCADQFTDPAHVASSATETT
jgi:YHS domain-containing protein